MALVALALVGASACRGGSDLKAVPPPAAAAAVAEAREARRATAPSMAALPPLHPVLADPRFAAVRGFTRTKDDGRAVAAFEEARRGSTPTPTEACAWEYMAGRLHAAADEQAEALAAFDRVAAPDARCPLAAYGSLRGAQAAAKLGRVDEALQRARAVPVDVAAQDDVRMVVAEALGARGDRVGALTEARAVLASSPRGPRWVEAALRIASLLVDGSAAGTAEGAEEALVLATRVVVEAPRIADSSGAEGLRRRAVALLRGRDPSRSLDLSDADRVRQAQAWLDGNDPTRAASAAAAFLRRPPPASDPGGIWCKAAILRGQALVRGRQSGAPDAWGDAITLCAGTDAQAQALYGGAKASLHGKRPDEAASRFAKLEDRFPSHRLADDARFHGALLALDGGDEERFHTLMTSMPDAYPAGDMVAEGLFREALSHMVRGRWEAARTPLEKILAVAPADRHWASAGRAHYFLGRVAQARGDVAGAKERYARVLEDYPLTFYMTQAFARLSLLDRNGARRILEAAVAKDDDGSSFPSKPLEGLTSPAFQRALRLLEVGELEAAKRELAAAGAAGDDADLELAWSAAAAFNAAGYVEVGHAFARGRLVDHLGHYPGHTAGGPWRTRWEIAYPRAFAGLVEAESRKNAIAPPLTWGVMREESGFVEDVRSPAAAFGLMQLIVPTARMVARGTGLAADEGSLKRAETSVALGTKLLAQLRSSFAANPSLAIAAYNGGAGAVRSWLSQRGHLDFDLWTESIPYEETRGYLKRVLASQTAYAFLYEPSTLDEVLAIPARVTAPGAPEAPDLTPRASSIPPVAAGGRAAP